MSEPNKGWDVTNLVVWVTTAFLLLAVINGLKRVVPLEKTAIPEYAMRRAAPLGHQ
jgi:hypothetical protein